VEAAIWQKGFSEELLYSFILVVSKRFQGEVSQNDFKEMSDLVLAPLLFGLQLSLMLLVM